MSSWYCSITALMCRCCLTSSVQTLGYSTLHIILHRQPAGKQAASINSRHQGASTVFTFSLIYLISFAQTWCQTRNQSAPSDKKYSIVELPLLMLPHVTWSHPVIKANDNLMTEWLTFVRNPSLQQILKNLLASGFVFGGEASLLS